MNDKSYIKSALKSLCRRTGIHLRAVNLALEQFEARHVEISAVMSLDDDPGARPSDRLMRIFGHLVNNSRTQVLPILRERPNTPEYTYVSPGEHYVLLPTLIDYLNAKVSIEIGTFTGLGVLAAAHALNPRRSLVTVDIVAYDQIQKSVLRPDDFERWNIKQILSDFSSLEEAGAHSEVLREADFIFCDGPKDGHFEAAFLDNCRRIGLKPGCILMFDDIRQWNMLGVWRNIRMPKLDITSIGHFTGTGLVEWRQDVA